MKHEDASDSRTEQLKAEGHDVDESNMNLYFMIINNMHHAEVSLTNLGMHETDDEAVTFAGECIDKMTELGVGWSYKIYTTEEDKIRELDISDEYYPPIEYLEKGDISWLFDAPCPR